jgi:hypothetical protein
LVSVILQRGELEYRPFASNKFKEDKMGRIILLLNLVVFLAFTTVSAQTFEMDVVKTSAGNLEVTFIGHASLMFNFGGKIIQVDPVSMYADYSKMSKADVILVTHDHADHFDPKAIGFIQTEKTALVLTQACSTKIQGGTIMNNGYVQTIQGIQIEAVPAYNIVSKRPDGTPFHPKGVGNGYIITFGNKRVYVAGDAENIPEMKELKGIDHDAADGCRRCQNDHAQDPLSLPFRKHGPESTDQSIGGSNGGAYS